MFQHDRSQSCCTNNSIKKKFSTLQLKFSSFQRISEPNKFIMAKFRSEAGEIVTLTV